jgi:ribosomal protein S18 acetylase RimI-like enzyme
MKEKIREQTLRNLLENDRVWSAYALADLDPAFSHHSEWLFHSQAVVLIYHGFDPPVLFCTGPPKDLKGLFERVQPGVYTYTLMGYSRALIRHYLEIETEEHMWRMVLKPSDFQPASRVHIRQLWRSDLEQIEQLFADHPHRPDAFSPEQLGAGIFYGSFLGDQLASVAGTHIVSEGMRIAALGNIFTHPQARNQGHATKTTSAVVEDLLGMQIETIVLNVSMNNHPALSCYRKLGFWPYCGYYEGRAKFSPEATRDEP